MTAEIPGVNDNELSPEAESKVVLDELTNMAHRLMDLDERVYMIHNSLTGNYKEVPTDRREMPGRFVEALTRYGNPANILHYTRKKLVHREKFKALYVEDGDYTRSITLGYATDETGAITETVTSFTYAEELMSAHVNGSLSPDAQRSVDLFGESLDDDDLAEVTRFVMEQHAGRLGKSSDDPQI